MVNLISNAIKYSGKNSKIIISLDDGSLDEDISNKESLNEDSFNNGSDWIKINISDDGVGIDKEIKEHIFERYFQGSSPQHLSEAGTGIGLSYVKDVMELHHGKVTLDSLPKQGCEFILWFKQGFTHFKYDEINDSDEKSVLQEQMSKDNLLVNEEVKDEINQQLNSLDKTTILIVEDNRELMKFLVFKFKDYYKVLEAENGQVGLDMAIKNLPDLIISDVMMPEMDGMELLSHLRKNNELKTVPIVLLTAMSANVDAIEGLETGADDYVTKPFDFDELKARVDRLIVSRKAVRDENITLEPTETIHKSSFQEKLDDTIHDHISDSSLNVEMLAELMYLDRSGLYRKIKTELNMTPIAYIRKIRMDFAKNLLTNKKLSVSETAYACGFESLSYFSKQFKKTYGTSPSDVL
ncbi:MAG: response regulator [Proteobacteria bacterium]|nr:response regulator [Pseudomonadota bacterium]